MSNKRYLEIDSTYRNRELYKNPSDFQVLIAQSGTRDASRAYDPVSDASPLKTWVPNSLELEDVEISIDQFAVNTKSSFIMDINSSTGSHTNNFYVGYPIKSTQNEIVKISEWTYLSTNYQQSTVTESFKVTVTPEFSDIPSGAIDFFGAEEINNLEQGIFFVPNGLMANNFYTGDILYNETKYDWRPIISYDSTLRVIGLNLLPKYGGIIDYIWKNSDTYSIRKKPPCCSGTGPNVSGYDPDPYIGYPANTSIKFTVNPDTIVRVGDFIKFGGSTESYRVVKYTNKGVLNNPPPEFPSAQDPYYKVFPYIITVNKPFITGIQPVGTPYEILQFTRDNAVPFNYSGSLVSQQEMVCYEIELLNLILPNILLASGGRTAFYPYVYVELQNVSGAGSGLKNVIYSNNPNSTRMLFRAAIDDIPNPLISPFVKIDGDGMVQTVKFKPNDNLKFGVYLPNGDPFETVEQDYFSPSHPNPLVQVSALFSIRRL
jgi:hypothetical protein